MVTLGDVRNRYHRFRESIAGITRYGKEGVRVGSLGVKYGYKKLKEAKKSAAPYARKAAKYTDEYQKEQYRKPRKRRYKYGNSLDIPRAPNEGDIKGEVRQYKHYGKLQPRLSGGGIYDAVTTDIRASKNISPVVKMRRGAVRSGKGGITLGGSLTMKDPFERRRRIR